MQWTGFDGGAEAATAIGEFFQRPAASASDRR